MIGYVLVGTADLAKSGAYYDALLSTIGAERFMEQDNYFIAWARTPGEVSFGVTLPFNKQAAVAGNGNMTAIALETPEQVNAFYNKALALGGTCEGAPGFRPHDATKGFYVGYFRDLDGNKLNAFCMVQ